MEVFRYLFLVTVVVPDDSALTARPPAPWPAIWLYSSAMRMPALRVLTTASLFLSLLACGRSSLSRGGAGSEVLEEFCSGGSAKAVINGVAAKAKVVRRIEVTMQCCQGASFTISTSSFDYKVRARWAVQFGHEEFPARVDLAQPGEGWRSWVELSCFSGEVCYPPPDAYDSAGQGWLEVSRMRADDFGSGYHMSICLRVAEAPESPHTLLHSFDLFAPDITAPPSR